jgi:uncharacterized protein (TIGR00297 family)
VAYPASLLLISLVFWNQADVLVVAWIAIAFGDGSSGLVQSHWPLSRLRWPWQKDKSLVGSLLFVLVSLSLSLLLHALHPVFTHDAGGSLVASLVLVFACAAWVETLPGLLDDNLSVPLAAAVAFFLVREMDFTLAASLLYQAAWGVPWIALLALMAWRGRKMTGMGALAGFFLASLLFSAANWPGLLFLGLFFAIGSGVSHWQRGASVEKHEVRSVRHALANGLAGTLFAVVFFVRGEPGWFWACAAAFGGSLSDTLSSEWGSRFGTRFIDLVRLKPGTRGHNGVVSPEGLLAGVAGALVIGSVVGVLEASWMALLVVTLSGFFGNVVDSLLGGTLEGPEGFNNEGVNFLASASAGFMALAWWLML